MKHHVCIAIGINQYQFLQPLSYAQQDAEALHSFLVDEAGFSLDQCLLMTDTSPPLNSESTYPSRDNILERIAALCQKQLKTGDVLWCFFSGYGICHEGQDYLMPIDGNPDEVAATGIPVRSILTTLNAASTETVLVLLDMNRSQGGNADDSIGTQTMELARRLEVPTLLSCRPNQVSREASALRHGFFTAALLEGLSSGQCSTLKNLARFLGERLPELCDHHLRPKQDPVMIVNPPANTQQVILPESVGVAQTIERLVATATLVGRNGSRAVEENSSSTLNASPTLTAVRSPEIASPDGGSNGSPKVIDTPDSPEVPPNPVDEAAAPAVAQESDSANAAPATPDHSPSPATFTQETMSEKPFLPQLLLWSCGTALLLLLGVFLTNRSMLMGQQQGNMPIKEGSPQSINLGTNSKPLSPASPQANQPKPVPPASSEVQLNQARIALQPNSASAFSNAISQARKIPANDPLYEQAQKDIQRWSLTILDIAEGRAKKSDFSGAVAAAALVPDTQKELYEQSRQSIASWQEQAKIQKANQALIASAKAKIQRGSASSYSNAIAQISTIQSDQPGYAQAKQLINEWSDIILKTAQLRARRGEYDDAVQAASLVPTGTASYAEAQKALAEWKRKL